ncbi:hypothetical protein LCGC14_1800250, partial [marine sediment metagenome]
HSCDGTGAIEFESTPSDIIDDVFKKWENKD